MQMLTHKVNWFKLNVTNLYWSYCSGDDINGGQAKVYPSINGKCSPITSHSLDAQRANLIIYMPDFVCCIHKDPRRKKVLIRGITGSFHAIKKPLNACSSLIVPVETIVGRWQLHGECYCIHPCTPFHLGANCENSFAFIQNKSN